MEKLEHFEPHVAPEWVTAPSLLAELSNLPLEDQLARVRDRLVYKQWGLCQYLLAESYAARVHDPRRSYDLAALGAELADLLNEVEYEPRWTADLRAKAHAFHANGLRLLGEQRAAEREFAVAESWVDQGLRQGRAEATVLGLKASLLMDQYRHLEAEALLERVEGHYRHHRQHRQAAEALLKLSIVSWNRGLAGQAAQRVGQAVDLLDAQDDALLRAVARHNLVAYLIDSGEVRQARTVFEEISEMPANRMLRLRRFWLAGDLHKAEGDLEAAARSYDDTRVGYLAEGLHYKVALVSLDLAMVAAAQDRHEAVRELARDAVVLLARAGAPEKSFAVIRLLLDTLERRTVTVAFIERIARRLARLQPAH
jgi:hypothetical protein